MNTASDLKNIRLKRNDIVFDIDVDHLYTFPYIIFLLCLVPEVDLRIKNAEAIYNMDFTVSAVPSLLDIVTHFILNGIEVPDVVHSKKIRKYTV